MGALARSPKSAGLSKNASKGGSAVIPTGTVVLPVGDKFVGAIDMLTHDWFKALPPIRGFSPVRFTKKRQRRLSAQLADAHADYLLVDNTTALATLGEMEPSGRWRQRYDAFIATCLEHFPSDRIILVRSHASRLWLDDKLEPAPTAATADHARALAELDERFIAKTSCRVSDVPLRHFPVGPDGFVFDKSMASDLEHDIVRLCTEPTPRRRLAIGRMFNRSVASAATLPVVADTIVSQVSEGRRVDATELSTRLTASADATWDDLIALYYLETAGGDPATVQRCVEAAARQTRSAPARATSERAQRSLTALHANPGCTVALPSQMPDLDEIVYVDRRGRLRFAGDGTVTRVLTDEGEGLDVQGVADGSTQLSVDTVSHALDSWPLYLERARRGSKDAMVVAAQSPHELVASCTWLDWEELLDTENLIVVGPDDPAPPPSLPAKVDLSFLFDPATRIVRVSGGMMDQVQIIAGFASACASAGKKIYLHDFHYSYARVHNGFVASQLAPWLEERRITRLISRRLHAAWVATIQEISVPDDAVRNAMTWIRLGLHELMGYAQWGYPTGVRIVEAQPDFPVVMMKTAAMQRDLIGRDLPPVPMFIHAIMIAPFDGRGRKALKKNFSYSHLGPENLSGENERVRQFLTSSPTLAVHVRRGDYVQGSFPDWHAGASQYKRAIEYVRESVWSEGQTLNIAVFSDDPAFVNEHAAEYGLDLADGEVITVDWNWHFDAVWDSYLMSLCPVVIASVGRFAATSAMLAEAPNTLIRTVENRCWVIWGPE